MLFVLSPRLVSKWVAGERRGLVGGEGGETPGLVVEGGGGGARRCAVGDGELRITFARALRGGAGLSADSDFCGLCL